MSKKAIDLTGQKFGSWLVLRRGPNTLNGKCPRWHCKCSCGREVLVQGRNLRDGRSRGCRSCHVKSIHHTKHGQSGTTLYHLWGLIIHRCESPNCKSYKRYGGRGIGVCSEWRNDPMAFIKWAWSHGYKKGLTIDRINNDGDYEPENCQWITRSKNVLKGWHIDGSYKEKCLKVS